MNLYANATESSDLWRRCLARVALHVHLLVNMPVWRPDVLIDQSRDYHMHL